MESFQTLVTPANVVTAINHRGGRVLAARRMKSLCMTVACRPLSYVDTYVMCDRCCRLAVDDFVRRSPKTFIRRAFSNFLPRWNLGRTLRIRVATLELTLFALSYEQHVTIAHEGSGGGDGSSPG
ncbi:hypothetical protein H257_01769 [Aphanomyces astaci]|uniref:Uncharacterized protein n=1 Tax=Aphanomyces astaci TaxID=112090 RepID=W4H6A3_APHAT|nr:hypothetical protein H257_01769 [Aphanomyces astaci]ETV86643.1 hypothetical protein H257_01769 [Aphanomyces astaci]|eukprot:XP_009823442.1 hypothetical protein H257_01769 [Aphanomyces astaci]